MCPLLRYSMKCAPIKLCHWDILYYQVFICTICVLLCCGLFLYVWLIKCIHCARTVNDTCCSCLPLLLFAAVVSIYNPFWSESIFFCIQTILFKVIAHFFKTSRNGRFWGTNILLLNDMIVSLVYFFAIQLLWKTCVLMCPSSTCNVKASVVTTKPVFSCSSVSCVVVAAKKIQHQCDRRLCFFSLVLKKII